MVRVEVRAVLPPGESLLLEPCHEIGAGPPEKWSDDPSRCLRRFRPVPAVHRRAAAGPGRLRRRRHGGGRWRRPRHPVVRARSSRTSVAEAPPGRFTPRGPPDDEDRFSAGGTGSSRSAHRAAQNSASPSASSPRTPWCTWAASRSRASSGLRRRWSRATESAPPERATSTRWETRWGKVAWKCSTKSTEACFILNPVTNSGVRTPSESGRLNWWRWVDLNHRHRAYETPALPLSYTARSRTIPGDAFSSLALRCQRKA